MTPSLRRALPLATIAAALAPATAAADVTRTTITEPSAPTYRLYDSEPKQAGTIRVVGTTDGADGDLHDLVCGAQRVARNVASKGGRFEVTVPYGNFKPAACILRAVPYKYDGPEFDTFTGPPIAITYFNARTRVTEVRGGEVVPFDFEIESGHRRGYATITSGQLRAQYGILPSLDRAKTPTWTGAARIDEVVVDGRQAYVGTAIPRLDIEGRLYAPTGFDGVQVKAEVDPKSGVVTIVEIARALRCDAPCIAVIDTGVRLERTITLATEHAHAEVRDRWVSMDGAPHAVRVEYSHGAAATRWRLPGTPAFRTPAPGDPIPPGPLLVHDGTPDQHMGALTSEPAPAVAMFTTSDRATEVVALAAPATVRRLFEVGENLVEDDPAPTPQPDPGPGPGAPQDPDDPQPDHPGIYHCTVPKVKAGATLKAAKAAIKDGNCNVGTTRKARSGKVKKGRVIALSRKAGTRLSRGARVGIKVSRGRR